MQIELRNTDGSPSTLSVAYPAEEPEVTIARLRMLIGDLHALGVEYLREPTGYVIQKREAK